MKKLITSFLLPVLFLFIFACSGENAEQANVEDKTTTEANVKDIAATATPERPPVTAEVDSIVTKLSLKSPFLKEGCCKEKNKRKDDCCCDSVIKRYKSMVDKKDKNLAKYKMTDPILGDCRRKMPKAFDQIDNPAPPPAKDGEENYDDLF